MRFSPLPAWKKNYYLYQSAMFVSLLGDFLGSMALHWWLLNRSEGIGALSCVFLVGNVVRLVSLPLLGPIGDRYSRKNLLNFADSISALLCLILALFVFFDNTSVFLLCGLTGLSALASSLFRAGSFGMVPELVPREKLPWAISQNQVVFTLSVIIGGAVGSLFISLVGVFWTLLLNATTIGIAIVLIRKIDMSTAVIVSEQQRLTVREWFDDLVSGMRFIKQEKIILTSFIVLFLINALLTPFDLLLPYYVQKIRLATVWEFGLIESSIGVGSILGTLIFSFTLARDHSFRSICAGVLLIALSFASFGITKGLMGLMILGMCIGIGEVLFFIPIRTKMTLILPHRFRSRVGVIFMFGQQVGKPLAISLTTILSKSFSVATILTSTSLLILLLIPALLLLPFYLKFLGYDTSTQDRIARSPLLPTELKQTE